MKEWIVIHQIKTLYDNGNGLSTRKIAGQLGISRNTVTKYLEMNEPEITAQHSHTGRAKKLDAYRDYIIHLLQTYPGLSAVKVLRKLKLKHETLSVSNRSIRRYIKDLKQEVSFKQPRYYEPVLDMVPGEQCQVDGGELRRVMINNVETTVYLMVFVLSYSRLMYVAVSDKPINTEMLIEQHDAAFRYFGGMPAECVYDQTKLVVIDETFRELTLNQRFHQYATAAGFYIRACEGYDPESKGKVEAGVKYAKHNGLYGESFSSWSALEHHMSDWLDNIANERIHATTRQQPALRYQQDEKAHMLPYLQPSCLEVAGSKGLTTRKVDKTGLIAWASNKYSVPFIYQQTRVGISDSEEKLRIVDLETGEIVAEHGICFEKGQIIKNTDHYRDKTQLIDTLEAEITQLLDNAEHSKALCALLKATSPKIYKDQLAGAKLVLGLHCKRHGTVDAELLARTLDIPRLTATGLRDRLEAYQQHPQRLNEKILSTEEILKNRDALAHYASLNGQLAGQGERHVLH